MRKAIRSFAPVLCSLALTAHFGCNGDAGVDDTAADASAAEHHGDHDVAGNVDEDEGASADVPCTPDYPPFKEGVALTASEGDVTVRVLTVDPIPPRQKVDNDWVLEVISAEGTPIADAMIQSADSYMVVHNHYGRRRPIIQVLAEPGRFKLDNIDFRMRGPWLVIVNVQTATGKMVSPTLKICVE